ncbi:MAG: DarT ssDNA thymidine ADP-ribosyltransferase family protein [bacterium]|nr:DarT ssDNA thymidine ADP-ribosyltransferase family protein [bacterium]
MFHFTDLSNAVKILGDGHLLSRSELEKTGGLATDIASQEIIASTALEWKDYVRLYFRPRTPMQYRNEGFRPVNQRELGGAHCAVPIIFIFEAKQILTDQATCFSDGNLAANAQVGDSSDFFLLLPFEKIYHNGSLWGLSEAQKRNIIFHRHAEVIVPKSLDLSSLKFIWCRSQAEFETLIHLLPRKACQKWLKKIGSGNRPLLFYAQWSFIEKTDLSNSTISFTFNPSRTPGPFYARIELEEVKTKIVYSWREDGFYTLDEQAFDLSNMTQPEHYIVKFWLDEQLAYQNSFLDESELPF